MAQRLRPAPSCTTAPPRPDLGSGPPSAAPVTQVQEQSSRMSSKPAPARAGLCSCLPSRPRQARGVGAACCGLMRGAAPAARASLLRPVPPFASPGCRAHPQPKPAQSVRNWPTLDVRDGPPSESLEAPPPPAGPGPWPRPCPPLPARGRAREAGASR